MEAIIREVRTAVKMLFDGVLVEMGILNEYTVTRCPNRRSLRKLDEQGRYHERYPQTAGISRQKYRSTGLFQSRISSQR